MYLRFFFSQLDSKSDHSIEQLLEVPLSYLPTVSKRLRGIHVISFPSIENERQILGRSIGIIESIVVASKKIIDEQKSPESFENIQKTLIVELTIEGLKEPILGVPNRKLLKSGLIRISRKKNQSQVYLFNDVIIIADKIVNTNKFKFYKQIYPSELSSIQESGSKIILSIGTNKNNLKIEKFSFKNNRSEKVEWNLVLNHFVESYRTNCVYGTPLSIIIEREEIPEKIPFVMVICIKYIKGLFIFTVFFFVFIIVFTFLYRIWSYY